MTTWADLTPQERDVLAVAVRDCGLQWTLDHEALILDQARALGTLPAKDAA